MQVRVLRFASRYTYLAAYEAGVYRTDDGGLTWKHLESYPSEYAHSVLVHPQDAQTVYVGSEPATIFCSRDGGESWEECAGFRAVPEAPQWFFHSETRQSHVRDLRLAPHDPVMCMPGLRWEVWSAPVMAVCTGSSCPAPTMTFTVSA